MARKTSTLSSSSVDEISISRQTSNQTSRENTLRRASSLKSLTLNERIPPIKTKETLFRLNRYFWDGVESVIEIKSKERYARVDEIEGVVDTNVSHAKYTQV